MVKIRLFTDNTVDADVASIVKHLNAICKNVEYVEGQSDITIHSGIISYPATHDEILKLVERQTNDDYLVIVVTRKQYDNNYFFQYSGKLVVLSLFMWESLTKLPINNGIVFFIADFLALKVDRSFRHGIGENKPNPNCIYDWGGDKTNVDKGMRSASICRDCISRLNSTDLSDQQLELFEDLKKILNDLGSASKWDKDIIKYWEDKVTAKVDEGNDERKLVFISYSHADEYWLKRLQIHLKPFTRTDTVQLWDDTKIEIGADWKKDIKDALNATRVAVLIVSADFLASDFVATDELPPLLSAAQDGGAKIMPIIVSACIFEDLPSISKFQASNSPDNPLNKMNQAEQEEHLCELAKAVVRELET